MLTYEQVLGAILELMSTDAHLCSGMASNSKTGGATPCQFDSDLGHHLPIADLELSMNLWTVIAGISGLDDY